MSKPSTTTQRNQVKQCWETVAQCDVERVWVVTGEMDGCYTSQSVGVALTLASPFC